MSDARMSQIERLAEWVKFDYERTMETLDGTVRVSANVRTLAIAVWTGLIAAAIQVAEWRLAIVGVWAVAIFALLDGYHGWLYRQCSERAYQMEGLLARCYKLLQRREESHEVDSVLAKLRQHKYGQLTNFSKHTWGFYFRAKPYVVYWLLYPVLLIFAAVVAAIVG
jgi:hypothetical protein